MTTNEKQNKRPEAGKKELTPRQIQMRKKMVVFPLFFLAFAGCMWLIFSPYERIINNITVLKSVYRFFQPIVYSFCP